MGNERRGKREIARQEVMVTPDGPIELYRKDKNGNEIKVPLEKVAHLAEKYRQRTNATYRPVKTSHGPGLRGHHRMVSGDNYKMNQYSRSYIYHRPAFDWYNGTGADLIDDIEEVLEPVSQAPFYSNTYDSDYDYNYDPHEEYHRRNRSCSRTGRSKSRDNDVIYIVKKKPERQQGVKEESKPVYQAPQPVYKAPQPVYQAPPPAIVYQQPEKPTVVNNAVTSIANTIQTSSKYSIDDYFQNLPSRTKQPQVIYHGQTAKSPNSYNYNEFLRTATVQQPEQAKTNTFGNGFVQQMLADLKTVALEDLKSGKNTLGLKKWLDMITFGTWLNYLNINIQNKFVFFHIN